jgi:hypothetical protein
MDSIDHAQIIDLPDAIARAGGTAMVGRAFGITSQAVSQWSRCPADRARKLAELAGVHPYQIRPDLYDPPATAAVS